MTHTGRPELTRHAHDGGTGWGEAPWPLMETISGQEAPQGRGEQQRQAGELHLCPPWEGSKQEKMKPIWFGEESWLMEHHQM